MASESLSIPLYGEAIVPDYLVDQINEAGSSAHDRDEAPVHAAAGVFLKDIDEEIADFSARATEKDKEAFRDTAKHLSELLGISYDDDAPVSSPPSLYDMLAADEPKSVTKKASKRVPKTERIQRAETERASKFGESTLRTIKTEWIGGTRKASKVKHKATVQTIDFVSKLPGTFSKETAQQKIHAREDRFIIEDDKRAVEAIELEELLPVTKEKSESRLSKVRSSLGRAATWLKELPRQRDVIEKDEDAERGFAARFGNRLKTKEAVTAGIGAAALTGAVLAGALGPSAMEAKIAHDSQNMIYAGITYAIEQHNNIGTTALVFGGNKEWRPSGQLVEQALAVGINVEGADYKAEMGPLAGTIDSRESLNDGASTFVNRANELLAAGQNVRGIGYSWGSVNVAEGYHRLKVANGGQYPEGVEPPILYGAPLGPNGAFNGPFGKVAMGVLGVNPDIIKDLPKGTTFIYGERDPFATAGPGSQPLTDAFNVMMIPKGTHSLDGDVYITVEDDNGNYHKIKRFDAAAALGLTGAGHDELNAAIDKLFPVNNDPDSKVRPKADAIAAMFYGAQALDRMVDGGTGQFTLFEDIQAQLPPEWKKLVGDSVDGINDSTVAVMDCFNTGDPIKCKVAFDTVMVTVNKVMGDLNAALGRDMSADIKNGGINVAAKNIAQYTGLDYNKVHQQLSSFTEMLLQPRQTDPYAPQYGSVRTTGNEASNRSDANSSVPSAADTVPHLSTQNNFTVDVPSTNTNTTSSAAVQTPFGQAQGSWNGNRSANQAPASHPDYRAPVRLDIPKATVTEPAQPAAPAIEAPAAPAWQPEARREAAPTPPLASAPAEVRIPSFAPAPLAPAPTEAPTPPLASAPAAAAPAPAPAAPLIPRLFDREPATDRHAKIQLPQGTPFLPFGGADAGSPAGSGAVSADPDS